MAGMVQLRGGPRTVCGTWFSSMFATDLGQWNARTLEVPVDPGWGGWLIHSDAIHAWYVCLHLA